VLSPEFGWGQSVFNPEPDEINAYRKQGGASNQREEPEACWRLATA